MTDRDEAAWNQRARIWGGLGLLGAACLLLLVDALRPDPRGVDPIVLGLMLGTGSLLLGVEGIKRVTGNGG